MAEKRSQRRLAAILAADVVGYSRLIQLDEAGTLAVLKSRRHGILDPLVADHQGRIVKLMGDGVLVEFSSAVNAVACAVELQSRFSAANDSLTEDQRILLRIGVNLGDIVVDADDIFGDGVNIAARLEAQAEPGGILISAKVHDEVRGKLGLTFDDRGEQKLKNIVAPVRVYRVLKVSEERRPTVDRESVGKPSIAVLPFTNMSGDTDQEYFSDGITEDIITELSRFTGLFVISRNSSFTLKGQAVDVREAGRRLGARFVIEGSVRKAGQRVRVTAQLVETGTGSHLWAERYDRDLDDIFAVQDEIVKAISGAIPGRLDHVAIEQVRRKTPGSLTAYEFELRGRWAFNHWNEGPSIAVQWFEKAIEADPNYALAHAGAAMAYSNGLLMFGMPSEVSSVRAKEHAHKAVALDERNPTVNAYAAFTFHLAGEYKLALTHAERAVSLNPNDPFTLYVRAGTLLYAGGNPEQALEWLKKSETIEPYASDDYRIDMLVDCYYMLRDYEKAIELQQLYVLPAFLKLILAAALAQLGRIDQAKAAVEDYQKTRHADHDAVAAIRHHLHMCSRQEDRDNWLEGYRKAGLPV